MRGVAEVLLGMIYGTGLDSGFRATGLNVCNATPISASVIDVPPTGTR